MKSENPKVFVSYASADDVFADLVKLKLNSTNIDVWMDNDKLTVGEEWRNEIDSGITHSDAIILILTKNSADSSYVTYEWAFALGQGIPVIPILRESCEIHPRLKVLQYLDFQSQRSGPWEKLFERIKSIAVSGKKGVIKVSDLSIEELQKIFAGSIALANANAKAESRSTDSNDINEAANQLISAKTILKNIDNRTDTILWVDDRPENNTYEREAFESMGFTFDLALSTNEAVELLKKNKYAAIISDMGRKEGPREGYALLKILRKNDKETPFFIYASSNLIEHKVEAQEKGAQGSTNVAKELIDLVTTHIKSDTY